MLFPILVANDDKRKGYEGLKAGQKG